MGGPSVAWRGNQEVSSAEEPPSCWADLGAYLHRNKYIVVSKVIDMIDE